MKINKFIILTALVISYSVPSFSQQNDKKGPPPGGGRGPKLTDEQKSCLDGILGSPEERSERPSHEEMDAAMKSCGISKPEKLSKSRSAASEESAQEE
ncbi:MAG: hypothetical protein AAGB31_00065 [Bdellovibrio sp.]